MKAYQFEIRQEVSARKISSLFHFTPLENVRSVLINGLASRVLLEENGISFVAPDTMRLDDCLDGLSVSIESINESMFEAKKRQHRFEWAIVRLDASVLWTHSCRFCWVNAASSEIRKHSGFKGGPWALRQMFEDRLVGGESFRSKHAIPDYLPTRNDAEVQVLDPIDSSLINAIIVRTEKLKANLAHFMDEHSCLKTIFVMDDM